MRRKTKTRTKSKSKLTALGLFQVLLFTIFFYLLNGVSSSPLETQSASAQSAALAFRPIGSDSAVDRYSQPGNYTVTASDQRAVTAQPRSQSTPSSYAPVRQVSMQSGSFSAPPTASASPMASAPPMASATPRTLPSSTLRAPSYSAPPIADYAPVVAPQLSNGGYATTADCRLITPPSSYTAMSPYGDTCGSVAPSNYATPYNPPPAQIAAPAVMPPVSVGPPITTAPGGTTLPPVLTPPPATVIAPPSAAPVGSLMTFGQETLSVQVGQGLWGQPVAYVPGQKCRNWLRYLSF